MPVLEMTIQTFQRNKSKVKQNYCKRGNITSNIEDSNILSNEVTRETLISDADEGNCFLIYKILNNDLCIFINHNFVISIITFKKSR